MRSERVGFRCWSEDDLPLALKLSGEGEVTGLPGGPLTAGGDPCAPGNRNRADAGARRSILAYLHSSKAKHMPDVRLCGRTRSRSEFMISVSTFAVIFGDKASRKKRAAAVEPGISPPSSAIHHKTKIAVSYRKQRKAHAYVRYTLSDGLSGQPASEWMIFSSCSRSRGGEWPHSLPMLELPICQARI
jgi:hypothetical protein